MKNEWNARFEKDGADGREVLIGKTFRWGLMDILVPSVYVCEEGLIVDLCMEVDRETERIFLDKWRPLFEQETRGQMPTNREWRQFERENPLDRLFSVAVSVNGANLQHKRGNGMQWIPKDLIPIMCDEIDIKPFMLHYGLSPERVWQFRREMFLWEESGAPELRSLEPRLRQMLQECPGPAFSMPGIGEQVTIENPVNGGIHTLTVTDIRKESVPIPQQFAQYEMPSEVTVMAFELEPNLKREFFHLADTREQDQARNKDGSPYHGGCVGMMLRIPKDGTHAAASSMRFTAPDTVEWEPVFRTKTLDDITVTLL